MHQRQLLPKSTNADRGALFSPCRTWRYTLWRHWADGPWVAFVGLNPSTADENVNDPTVTRCCNFAASWGYGGMWMLNLFGFRATLPRIMLACDDPIGPDNDRYLRATLADPRCGRVVCCWGAHGSHRGRSAQVLETVARLAPGKAFVLAWTKSGEPGHPLYLPASTTLISLESSLSLRRSATAAPEHHPSREF